MIKASIIGASGYTGGDLLRILLSHPEVSVEQVTSEGYSGVLAYKIHPNLRGFTTLEFTKSSELDKDVDVIFLCTPHGVSMQYVSSLIENDARIIDLSADFRLRSESEYEKWYGKKHSYPELLGKAVYGLPELHREEIKNAKLVACPGCLSTSAILALAPLVAKRMIDFNHIVIDSKIGSSGAGHKADESTHHPERANVVRAYKPTGHRHTGEMEQELGKLAGADVKVAFSPHGVDMVRGIMTTAHVFLTKETQEIEVWKTYRGFYTNCPFIRFVKEKTGIYRYPEPKNVMGTNFCDIGFELDSNVPRLVAMSAIDNLVKGSGGQAVQCMNLMFNLDEKMGLWVPSLHPA